MKVTDKFSWSLVRFVYVSLSLKERSTQLNRLLKLLKLRMALTLSKLETAI
jgi:hypothetical protein